MSYQISNNEELKISELLKAGDSGVQREDIKITCHQLCKDYLGGVWCNISEEKINIRRITGGLTNQLYYCGVLPDVKPVSDEPTEVAIRFYVKKHLPMSDDCHNERYNDIITGIILSENNLGPKIYGFFGNGEILKYYKNHQFQHELQKDPELVRELAQKLAKFHSLKVPIKRNNNLIFDLMHKWYSKANELYPISQMLDQNNCQTLKQVNLIEETEWLHKVVKNSNSPTVFTHFDFRGSNILVIDRDVIDYDSQSRIVLCDFEYADYYNRGNDFSSIFMEWGRHLDDMYNMTEFPEPSLMTPFIKAYIEESAKIYGENYLKDNYNNVEHIIYETNVFILVRCLFSAIMFMRLDDSPQGFLSGNKRLHLIMAESSIKTYLQLKKKLLN